MATDKRLSDRACCFVTEAVHPNADVTKTPNWPAPSLSAVGPPPESHATTPEPESHGLADVKFNRAWPLYGKYPMSSRARWTVTHEAALTQKNIRMTSPRREETARPRGRVWGMARKGNWVLMVSNPPPERPVNCQATMEWSQSGETHPILPEPTDQSWCQWRWSHQHHVPDQT